MKILHPSVRTFIHLSSNVERAFLDPLGSALGRAYLRAHGVVVGKEVRVLGLPIVGVVHGASVNIGDRVTLRSRSKGNAIGIAHPIVLRAMVPGARITVSDDTGISGGAICANRKVHIGRGVLLGADVVIADNDFHGLEPGRRRARASELPASPVVIEDNVWIGAGCYVGKGVTIGRNSVIGARSVVTKSIPENCLAAGVPAKVLRRIASE